ncbi:MAG: NifB/NifX family molybdenum-iron cluster-binding protein [Pirellulaceae bacterium]|jgi:predicted Fe-Mo cluster-binding NifX family protein|nr:NifB/NifX family molybdenum-iron cluster-binding protein [Pirellulaceae bacterium]
MKIAIPVSAGRLCSHFGHCEQFALVEIDEATRQPKPAVFLTPPPHEPGVLPRWLHEQGAQVVIAGGMGQRAQQLFGDAGIQVVVGADSETPAELVEAYLDGSLTSGQNPCDH